MRTGASHRGFTVFELVAAVTAFGFLVTSSVAFIYAVARIAERPVIVYGGKNYVLAPVSRTPSDGVAKTDLSDAVALHLEFARQVANSDFVAVFGGTNASPGAPAPLPPLLRTFSLTSLPALAAASPAALTSTPRIASAAAANLAAHYDNSAGTGAFSVLLFRGVNEIIGIAQVRRHVSTNDGQPVALYETSLMTRDLPTATWTTFAYNFWLPAEQDTWSTPVGATHAWFRHESGSGSGWFGRTEEAGATLVFPDPYNLAVLTEDSKVEPISSRFTYFVAVSPFN